MTLTENIYINMIDGTNVWVPVKARKIEGNIFLILEVDEYDESDPTCLVEYFPGDTVEVEEYTFQNERVGKVARSLVSPTSNPSRKYFDFLYKILQKKIPLDTNSYKTYKEEIKRVRKEYEEGQYFYPDILKYIDRCVFRSNLPPIPF